MGDIYMAVSFLALVSFRAERRVLPIVNWCGTEIGYVDEDGAHYYREDNCGRDPEDMA
jgi:hypothetical protein